MNMQYNIQRIVCSLTEKDCFWISMNVSSAFSNWLLFMYLFHFLACFRAAAVNISREGLCTLCCLLSCVTYKICYENNILHAKTQKANNCNMFNNTKDLLFKNNNNLVKGLPPDLSPMTYN